MIVWAFNLLVLAIGILIVGLINPKWILFWWEKKEPTRIVVIGMSLSLLMGAAVLFGEGNRQNEPLSEIVKKDLPVVIQNESPADLVTD